MTVLIKHGYVGYQMKAFLMLNNMKFKLHLYLKRYGHFCNQPQLYYSFYRIFTEIRCDKVHICRKSV